MNMRSIVPFGWGGSMQPRRLSGDDPFVRLWNDVDQLFSDMIRGTGLDSLQPGGNVGLPMEVYETENEIKVVAELPGVEEGRDARAGRQRADHQRREENG